MQGTVIGNSNTNSAIRGLTFHNSALRQNPRTTFHKSMLRKSEQIDEAPESAADVAVDAIERRKAGARRTAWILAAIAAGFFIASLFEGHFVQIPH